MMLTRSPLKKLACSNTAAATVAAAQNLRSTKRGRGRPAGSSDDSNDASNNKIGRWSRKEKVAFLKGLQIHGRGKWKKISMMIPTRNTIQVKTHAQVMLKKLDHGVDIFQLLHEEEGNNNHRHHEEDDAKQEDRSSVDEMDERIPIRRTPDYTIPITSNKNVPVWVNENSKQEIAAARSLVLLSSASRGY